MLGYAGNNSFLHKLFDNLSADDFLDGVLKNAENRSQPAGPSSTAVPKTDVLLRAIDHLRQI